MNITNHSIGQTCLSRLLRSKSLASLRSPLSSTVRLHMKKIVFIFVVVFITVVLIVNSAKPNAPAVSGQVNYDAGVGCLREVPKKYSSEYFTFKAWVMAWYAHHADKWGVNLGRNLSSFYKSYIKLQLDVDCYISLSKDNSLNMALSPTEFKTVYNLIAKNHELEKIE